MRVSTKRTLSIFWSHTLKYPKTLVCMVIGITLVALAGLAYPFIMRQLFNGLAHHKPGTERIYPILYSLFAVLAIEWCGWRLGTYGIIYLQTSTMRDLDMSCFAQIHKHSYRFFSDNFVGSLVKKANRFSRAFETICDRIFFNIFLMTFRIIGSTLILFMLNRTLGLILGLWALLYVGIVYVLTLYKLRYDVKTVAADTKCTGILADTITNATAIKLFTGQSHETETYRQAKHEQWFWRKTSWYFSIHMETFQAALLIALEIGIFYWGLQLWEQGKLNIGDFALIQGLLVLIFRQIFEVSRVIKDIYRSLADAEEMTEIFDAKIEVSDAPNARELETKVGEINFDAVGFGYTSARAVFSDLNLQIPSGQKVAIIGPSGSGKSTLTKLLLRYFDIQHGAIKIDGQNTAQVSQESLRKSIAFVPQEPVLFHRPLIENIRYGRPDATDEEVIEAATKARCHEFIQRLPNQYQTLVGERGIKLSGGERQRVAIARAILKNAPILILDEATSSLDSESEILIQRALETLMQNRTTLVIAHRLSTIMSMDRIVVMQDGKVVEQGTHDELLAMESGLYQRLWSLQAGSFNSDNFDEIFAELNAASASTPNETKTPELTTCR